MSAEPKPGEFDDKTQAVREYAQKHGVTNAIAAKRLEAEAKEQKETE
jgi:hypothetical protein